MARPTTPTLARIFKCTDVRGPTECWPWRGYCPAGKYPKVTVTPAEARRLGTSQTVTVSRYLVGMLRGRVGRGVVVAHSCDSPSCVNPQHLLAATQAENLADASRKGRLRGIRRARMSRATVTEVRTRHAGGETVRAIAASLGLRAPAVRRAVAGRTYRVDGNQS